MKKIKSRRPGLALAVGRQKDALARTLTVVLLEHADAHGIPHDVVLTDTTPTLERWARREASKRVGPLFGAQYEAP